MAKPLNGVSPVRRLTPYFAVSQQMANAACFAVCQLMAKSFAIRWQMAKSPNRPAQILHVDDTWPLCLLPADGKALCHLPADGKVPILPHLILFFLISVHFHRKSNTN